MVLNVVIVIPHAYISKKELDHSLFLQFSVIFKIDLFLIFLPRVVCLFFVFWVFWGAGEDWGFLHLDLGCFFFNLDSLINTFRLHLKSV